MREAIEALAWIIGLAVLFLYAYLAIRWARNRMNDDDHKEG